MTGWRDYTGLSDEKTRVRIYVPERDVEEWDSEVEERGYRSRSQYLYELVQEARAYREEGFLSHHRREEEAKQLREEIRKLEKQLEAQNKKSSGRTEITDFDFLEKFLSSQCKGLDQILKEIVESGALDDLIRKRVEDQLYFLAEQGLVEYRRGWGWKLAEDNGGEE